MDTPISYDDIDKGARHALNMGIATWVGNIGGCLIGMVPLALPVSVLLTIVTFFTGIAAMVMGWRASATAPNEQATRYALIAFWLGASHMFIVLLGAIAVGIAWQMKVFP